MSIGHTPLGLLESGPRHSCDLKRAFDEKLGHGRPPRCGQGYSMMSRLLKNGVVHGAEAGGGPERQRYAIAGARITDVQQWLVTPEKPEPYFRSNTHRGAADVLDTRCAEHLRSMRARTERKRGGELADQLIWDHALFHLGADLRRPELTEARRDRLREEVAR
ncbi:helix-turn-helix transcriptional regulator [Streptomyces sp. NBC_01762]|uniref:PadR family transcriptional regulator n=1 Tax=unclassified Streptomyces TaxID=2593676 RepID=UPI002DD9FABD|nr:MULTISPECIES: PadR family transcriptional regulator [unclassified Streptomyces]WSC42798.1 helix-turn-helix transcriptional regulator [Streptomyces sp. NBC_01762]WSD22332.1 helix-turn-helix transcriptional regulator [Streptomyces sp. NBC_01751]